MIKLVNGRMADHTSTIQTTRSQRTTRSSMTMFWPLAN
jgi:hypothetical protein